MKGVIIAGGKGTRLLPLTKNKNKHLLKVGSKEQILYPLQRLIDSGINQILIITQKRNINLFKAIIKKNISSTVRIEFIVVSKSLGTSYTLLKGRAFFEKGDCFVIYGDNIFLENFKTEVDSFNGGCLVFSKTVSDPHRFGILEIDTNNKVVSLEEKPLIPKSNLALVGAFIFDKNLLTHLEKVRKSIRGEYELTDVILKYLKEDKLINRVLKKEYFDMGTIESYREACKFFHRRYQRLNK